MKKDSILVTGGAGYIGSVLVPTLISEGYRVTVIDNLMHGQTSLLDCCANPNFDFIKGDISDYPLMNKILPKFDIIIPLAAIVGAPACKSNPSAGRLVNYDAQMNIVDSTSFSQ